MAFDAATWEVHLSAAAKLQHGTHTARWGAWLVRLRHRADRWDVKVWRWPPDTALAQRIEIGAHEGFALPDEAAKWACDVMARDGAIVMVLEAPNVTLERMLSFAPAPKIVG